MSAKRKFWLVGLALVAIGVVLARVVSKLYVPAELQLAVYILGVILALVGLGALMYGIRKS